MANAKGKLAEIELKLLRLTELNPRKIRNPEKDAELFASIAANGVVDPLLVRPKGKFFEIAAGSRRREGADRAKLKSVPCFVREMTDAEFAEIALFENLHRDDMHALDEADAYSRMVGEGLKVDAIALKVSKERQYVALTLKLRDLIPAARKLFASWGASRDAALLIARLTKAAQVDLMASKDRPDFVNEMWVRRWIEREVLTDLANAPFALKDAELVKKAGSCFDCPKRSGSSGTLFSDVTEKDKCFDRECFRAKMAADFEAKTKSWDAKGIKWTRISDYYSGDASKKILGEQHYSIVAKNPCEHTIFGIYADGTKVGHVVKICATPSCAEHRSRGGFEREAKTPVERFEERKKVIVAEKERALRSAIIDRIAGDVAAAPHGVFPRADLEVILFAMFDQLWTDAKRIYFSRRGLTPTKKDFSQDFDTPFRKYVFGLDDPQLRGAMIDVALNTYAVFENSDKKPLLKIAAAHGVDVAALEAAVAVESKAKLDVAQKKLDRSKEIAAEKKAANGRKKTKETAAAKTATAKGGR